MNNDRFVLALDQGTTSSRTLLIARDGSIRHICQQEFKQHFPHPGWVEHNPLEIWDSQYSVIRSILEESNTSPDQVEAIGITNQRETTVLWDRRTGEPIYYAIVWQDRRTSQTCEALKSQGYADMVRDRTGLPIDPYFSATKISWMLDHVDGARKLAEDGFLAFGTVDSWLIWNLTNGQQHLTDVTNASRTMLFNIHSLGWDDDLLHLFNIPRSILPRITANSGKIATCAHSVLAGDIPIAGVAGDQHAALFGQRCIHPGMSKNTYGTGAFLMMNTGDKIKTSKNNLISTLAWKIGNRVEYALEGSVFVAGAVVQWLRDGLGIIQSSSEIETLAASVPDSDGVVFVPAFTGLGAPHWDSSARGSIFGLTRGTTAAHLARAALESIALQSYDLLEAMQEDSGLELRELRVDGGAANNELLMQMQADLLEIPLHRPQVTESTAMGAAFLAGLATGFWKDQQELDSLWKSEHLFQPKADSATREELLAQWRRAIPRTKEWLQ